MITCLIVDDSGVIRKIARSHIEKLGFVCSEAATGDEAVVACRVRLPDAILLDWNMPGISGIECLKIIRAMPAGEQPKIVLCTTNSEIEQITEALTWGADEYIMKPFDAEIVRAKFEQVGLLPSESQL